MNGAGASWHIDSSRLLGTRGVRDIDDLDAGSPGGQVYTVGAWACTGPASALAGGSPFAAGDP